MSTTFSHGDLDRFHILEDIFIMDERRTGVWIDRGMYESCSVCGTEYDPDLPNLIHVYPKHNGMPNYCAMCGARLTDIVDWKEAEKYINAPNE